MGYGFGVKGSGIDAPNNRWQTSVADQEILNHTPADWSFTKVYYKFSFLCKSECHVMLNNDGEWKFCVDGFDLDTYDMDISSLKIKENGIQYTYWGGF